RARHRDLHPFPTRRSSDLLPRRSAILVTSAIVSGLCLGSMYGLIALGFHVTYVVSSTVNFSQGSSVMLGAVLGWAFAVRLGWPRSEEHTSELQSPCNLVCR